MPNETTTAVAKKLRLTAETRLLALHVPDDYVALLRQSGAVASLATAANSATYDAVHLFARRQEDARAALPVATAALRPGGVLWVMWPKKTSGMPTDLTRDTLAALTLAQGWGPVSNVSIDDTWSALRLRPEAEVKRTGRGFDSGTVE